MKKKGGTEEMLSKALDLEKKGKKFYDGAMEKCTNEVGRDIFKMLSDDELVHIDRIKTIYESMSGGKGWTDEWKSLQFKHKDLDVIFKEVANKHGRDIKADASDLEAIDLGLDFEQASVRFYEDHLKSASDEKEREFIERMVGEEKTHHATLTDMKLYLTDPSSWFIETERHSLDGA